MEDKTCIFKENSQGIKKVKAEILTEDLRIMIRSKPTVTSGQNELKK